MKRALVAIGVDNTASPIFQPLKAAAAGAREVKKWGDAQGFDSTLLTDETGAVSVADVFNAIHKYVDAAVYEQIVVYFSGHGVLLSPYVETWLLSGAVANPNEAINLVGSVQAARTCGIPHVVFISDACRSLPQNFMVGSITPGTVFPTRNPQPPRPKVDVFYAAMPGSVALELPPAQAVAQYRGLFTDCMLKALEGVPPTLIETVPDGAGVKHVVAPRPLQDHLEIAVPKAAAAVSIKLRQDPDAQIESILPKYLAEVTPPPAGATSAPPATLHFDVLPEVAFREKPTARFLSRVWSDWVARPNPDSVGPDTHALGVGEVRRSFETILTAERFPQQRVPGEDFVFHGLSVASVKVTGTSSPHELFGQGRSVMHSRSRLPREHDGQKRVALIQFENGSGMVLPVISDYVGSVVGEDGRVMTVNYTPDPGSGFEFGSRTLGRSRALVAALAREGRFRVDPDSAQATALLLRRYKRVDPTLGLFAAYAYAQGGNGEGVLSVFRYMSFERVTVPWDVAMLAAQYGQHDPTDDVDWLKPPEVLDFAPWMPLLTQGWMLLGRYEAEMPDVLRRARRYLLPGLWTTFAEPGVQILDQALFGREEP